MPQSKITKPPVVENKKTPDIVRGNEQDNKLLEEIDDILKSKKRNVKKFHQTGQPSGE